MDSLLDDLRVGIRSLIKSPLITVPAVLSLAMMRVFYSVFEGFIGFDGLALGGATLVLLLASLVACFLPARRAARLDAMAALRSE